MDTLDALLAGHDPAGLLAALDWCEERGLEAERLYLARYAEGCAEGEAMVRPPFEAGQKWLICTVTLYYVGEVAEVGLGWVRLKDAAWVHWTGRLSTLLRVQQWAGKEFALQRGSGAGRGCNRGSTVRKAEVYSKRVGTQGEYCGFVRDAGTRGRGRLSTRRCGSAALGRRRRRCGWRPSGAGRTATTQRRCGANGRR